MSLFVNLLASTWLRGEGVWGPRRSIISSPTTKKTTNPEQPTPHQQPIVVSCEYMFEVAGPV